MPFWSHLSSGHGTWSALLSEDFGRREALEYLSVTSQLVTLRAILRECRLHDENRHCFDEYKEVKKGMRSPLKEISESEGNVTMS